MAYEWMESIPVAHMFFHWVQYVVMLGILAFSLRVLKNLINVFLRTSVFGKTADFQIFILRKYGLRAWAGGKHPCCSHVLSLGPVWSDARDFGIFSQGFEKIS